MYALAEVEWGTAFSEPARVAGLIILVLIFVGVALRKNRKIHPKWMVGCFILDFALVAYLEIERAAATGLTGSGTSTDTDLLPVQMAQDLFGATQSYHLWLIVHILLATASFVYYILLLVTGPKVLKGRDDLQPRHKKFAWQFLVIRVLVFATAIPVTAYSREKDKQEENAEQYLKVQSAYVENALTKQEMRALSTAHWRRHA